MSAEYFYQFDYSYDDKSPDQEKVVELMKNARAKNLPLTAFAVTIAQELELFARGVTLIEAEHNMQSKDSTDLGDDPKFMNDPVSTGMRLQYGNPQFFKEEFVQEFFSWLARDTKTRIIQALPTDDQYYFLKRQAKGNLRQYVIWVFIHDQWLNVTGNQPELYWRSKHFAEEDYEAEIGILVKEKWDLR